MQRAGVREHGGGQVQHHQHPVPHAPALWTHVGFSLVYMKKHATYWRRRLRVRRSRAKKILNKFLKVFYSEAFVIENLKKFVKDFFYTAPTGT